MMFFMIVFTVLGGVAGVCLALYIVMTKIKYSNDIGGSRGDINDFGYIEVLSTVSQLNEEGLSKVSANEGGYSRLRSRCNKIESILVSRDRNEHK